MEGQGLPQSPDSREGAHILITHSFCHLQRSIRIEHLEGGKDWSKSIQKWMTREDFEEIGKDKGSGNVSQGCQ
jgi:hypothetical protein